MKKFSNLLVVSLAVLTLSYSDLSAQNNRTGTSAATQLLVPVGARDFAMGGSGIASSNGVEAIYWNPAGLARMQESAQGMFSNMAYIADIDLNYAAVGAQLGAIGTFALSVKTFNFGNIPLTTVDDPENLTGRSYSPNFSTFGISYANSLSDAISVGGSVKFVSEKIQEVSASTVAFDFGVQYTGLISVKGLSLGVALKNIGPQMRYEGPGLYVNGKSSDGVRAPQKYKLDAASFELPSLLEIGVAYSGVVTNDMQYLVNGTFTNDNLYLNSYKFGGEFTYTMDDLSLFARGGMQLTMFGADASRQAFQQPQSAGENIDIFKTPTVGFGFHYHAPGVSITVDYAYRSVQYFNGNQIVSIKLGF